MRRREVREDRPGLPRQPARLLVLHAGEEDEQETLRLPAGPGSQLAELVPLSGERIGHVLLHGAADLGREREDARHELGPVLHGRRHLLERPRRGLALATLVLRDRVGVQADRFRQLLLGPVPEGPQHHQGQASRRQSRYRHADTPLLRLLKT